MSKTLTIQECTCGRKGVGRCPFHSNILPDVPKQVAYFDDRFYWGKNPYGPEGETIAIESVTTVLGIIAKPFLARWRGEVGNEQADKVIGAALAKGANIHSAIATYQSGGRVLFSPPHLKEPIFSREEIELMWIDKLPDMVFPQLPVVLLRDQEEMLQVTRLIEVMEMIRPFVLAVEDTIFVPSRVPSGVHVAGTLDAVWFIPRSGLVNLLGEKEANTILKERKDVVGTLVNSSTFPKEYRESLPEEEDGIVAVVDFKTGKNYDEQDTFFQLAAYRHGLEVSKAFPDLWETSLPATDALLGIHLGAKTKQGWKAYLEHRGKAISDYLAMFAFAQRLWRSKNKLPTVERLQVPTILDSTIPRKESSPPNKQKGRTK